ncbi:MAG: flagellar M-ring protein FliF [Spartobacteria bacterium]|nr:flagellar M-ring protein FliF [Spartobacteria bacterium]
MLNSLSVLLQQLREIWRHFGVNQKFSTIMALIITIGFIVGLLYWASRPDYRLLYSGLTLKDASSIREKLEDEKIPLEIKDAGKAIFVPASEVYRARMLLAAEGLPRDNTAGFELFEEPKFGLTEFAQKVNYQRALQGELERTITDMNGIENARVMLVLPKDKLFASEEDKKASASVMLTVSGGVGVSPAQVASITHLIASSVPGLEPTGITVSDQTGRLLSSQAGSADSAAVQASDHLSAQERVETMLSGKAQAILDRALGVGRSIVRINVDMDFSKVEKRIENFDGDNKTVRAETIESESSSAPGGEAGRPAGVVANIPVGDPTAGTASGGMSKRKKENVRTEYAIPSDVEHVIMQGGRIKQITASVCVAQQEEPRTAEELKKIEMLVAGAVGLVDEGARKDSIEVAEMPFPDLGTGPTIPWWGRLPVPIDVLIRGILGATLLLIVYLVSRKVMAGLIVQREDMGVPIEALTPGEQRMAAKKEALARAKQAEEELEPVVDSLEEIRLIAEQNPKAIAAWITSIANENNA